MKLGTWIMVASIALLNVNCAHEEDEVVVVEQVKVQEHVDKQMLDFEPEAEGGCDAARQLMCMTYCGGYCTNNGQSCRCPRGTY